MAAAAAPGAGAAAPGSSRLSLTHLRKAGSGAGTAMAAKWPVLASAVGAAAAAGPSSAAMRQHWQRELELLTKTATEARRQGGRRRQLGEALPA